MIDWVHERCDEWARATIEAHGSGSSIISLAMENGGVLVRCTASSVPFSVNVQEIEKIILEFPVVQKMIFIEYYFRKSNTSELIKKLGISRKYLFSSVSNCHQFISDRLTESMAA